MQLEYTAKQEQLRAEIRATLERVMTPERSAAICERIEGGPEVRECVRTLAAANLLGVGWPKEFGGQGFSAVEQYIFAEELLDHNGLWRGADAPLPGALESAHRIAVINTFGGGANEIQRDIIAMAGLGMPRAPRDLRPTDKSGGPTQ
jgi:alkylation response protein AidB-like acyl-CoA dehydrogenase